MIWLRVWMSRSLACPESRRDAASELSIEHTPPAVRDGGHFIEKIQIKQLSGKEGYYTNALILLVMTIMCSKFRRL